MVDYVVRSLREDELEDMLALTSRSYNSSVETFRRIYENDPFYSFELTRVAERRGQLVSYLRAAPRTIWIGSSKIRMGGIAEVCTLQDFRRMGVATHLLKDMIRLMILKGYPVSMLYGRSSFYGRIGWERCCIVQGINLLRANVPRYAEADKVRDFQAEDLPRVMHLYDLTYAGRSCAIVRSKRHWTGRILRKTNQIKVYDDGKVRGYMACDPREEKVDGYTRRVLFIQEAGHDGPEAIRGLVGSLADLEECESVLYGGVMDDPFVGALSLPGASLSVGWDGMFRVNDVMGTLQSLSGEFRGFNGAITLRIEDDVVDANSGSFCVRGSGGDVSISRGENVGDWIEIGIRELSQLVPGTFSAPQLASLGRIHCSSRKALALASKLFPQRHPLQPSMDHI